MRWLLLVAVVVGCKRDDGVSPASDKEQLTAEMRHYDELVRNMATQGLAELFTTDGTIENGGKVMATGPIDIVRFLSTFDGKVKVETTTSTVETVHVAGDTANVEGHYSQTVRVLATNQVQSVAGTYHAEWSRQPTGWRIHHMRTTPNDR
jgi:SnoaL-like protein